MGLISTSRLSGQLARSTAGASARSRLAPGSGLLAAEPAHKETLATFVAWAASYPCEEDLPDDHTRARDRNQ